ncbi:MAG: hypothetical protein U0893_10120 [Chloroflexota bacterium]
MHPRMEPVPSGLYCLRGADGEWQPSVLALLDSSLTADLDFTSGTGQVVAAGRWWSDFAGIVVEDVVRAADGRTHKRHRRFDAATQGSRRTLTERIGGPQTGQLAAMPATYVFVGDDATVEVETSPGTFERRPVTTLIIAFRAELRARRIAQQHALPGVTEQTPPVVTKQATPAASQAPSPSARAARPEGVERLLPVGTTYSPYLTNAFRVLGLPTTADARDVSRRARERAMAASLDGDDEQARRIHDAETILADPVRRSADAVMWLRAATSDVASHLNQGDAQLVSAVVADLRSRAQQGDDDALHDVAVVAHAVSLEDARSPLTAWQIGLNAWGSLLARDRFWRAERLRADLADDPRLQGSTIDAQRAEIAWRVLEPSARTVAALVDAGRDADALPRLAAIGESGLPGADVARARALATASLRAALSTVERQIEEALADFDQHQDGERLFRAAEPFATRAAETVQRLTRLDPGSPEAAVRADALAEALRGVSVRLHNEADRTALSVTIVDRAATIAASDSVRARLTADARTLRRLDLRRRANDLAGREDWDGAARDLAAALQFADEPAERADIERSIATCRLNGAMRRAVRAAEAKDWATAIVAAESARPYVTDPQERAGLDRFIVRCRQARSRESGGGVKAVLIVVGLVLGLFGWGALRSPSSSSSTTTPRPVPTTLSRPAATVTPVPSKPVGPTTTPVTLPNGQQIQPPTRTGGRSYLDVVNGTPRDAVVKLVDGSTNAAVRFVFVSANNRARLEGIQPGAYRVRFATGQDWDSAAQRFRRDAAFTEFRESFDFTETPTAGGVRYTTGEITLNPVRGGNAPSDTIDASRF